MKIEDSIEKCKYVISDLSSECKEVQSKKSNSDIIVAVKKEKASFEQAVHSPITFIQKKDEKEFSEKSNKPTFDFRGKQYEGNKEKKKKEIITKNEGKMDLLEKPAFDFRNKK